MSKAKAEAEAEAEVLLSIIQHLLDITHEYLDNLQKLYSTYPELRDLVTCIIDVNLRFADTTLGCCVGIREDCLDRLKLLLERFKDEPQ